MTRATFSFTHPIHGDARLYYEAVTPPGSAVTVLRTTTDVVCREGNVPAQEIELEITRDLYAMLEQELDAALSAHGMRLTPKAVADFFGFAKVTVIDHYPCGTSLKLVTDADAYD